MILDTLFFMFNLKYNEERGKKRSKQKRNITFQTPCPTEKERNIKAN